MCRVTSIIGLRAGLIDMCGRFALDENPRKLAEHFLLSGEPEFSPSWNIAPSLRICTITADVEGSRHLSKMRWGQSCEIPAIGQSEDYLVCLLKALFVKLPSIIQQLCSLTQNSNFLKRR